jgi:hypothetical protein
MANNVKQVATSAAGNFFYALFILGGISFCAGVPLGMAARGFSEAMFGPPVNNVNVSQNR